MSQGESVTESAVKGTGYALIVVTSLVVIARFAGLVRRLKDLKAEDYLLLVAYALFIELSVLYIIITPAVFRLAALQKGLIAPYPTVEQDGHQMQIFMFVTTISLWLCLWMIKFSLLSMYKRFLSGKAYIVAWWTIITCCALFLIGAILSAIFSCSSLHDWFTPGACGTPRDRRASVISLYYGYAADLLTDFAIMVLPLRLIWNLQMRPNQKLSIGGLFCIGWVCIIAATIRVAQIGGNISKGQPAPSWLVLWGIIEASIAVIIGSAPGVYRIVKARVSQSRPSYYRYDSHGFHRATATATGTRSYGRDIALSPFPASKHSLTSSQENLASSTDRGNITVTSQVAVTVEDRDKLDGRGYIRFTGRGI